MDKKHLNIISYMVSILITGAILEAIFCFIYLVFYTYIQLYSAEFEFITLYDNTPKIIILTFIILMLDYLTIKITYWFNRKYYITFPVIGKIFGYFVFSGFTLYKLLATVLDIKVNSVSLIASVIILILLFVANDSSFNQFINNYDMELEVNISPGKIINTATQTYTMEQIQQMNERNMENSNNITNNSDNNGLNQ